MSVMCCFLKPLISVIWAKQVQLTSHFFFKWHTKQTHVAEILTSDIALLLYTEVNYLSAQLSSYVGSSYVEYLSVSFIHISNKFCHFSSLYYSIWSSNRPCFFFFFFKFWYTYGKIHKVRKFIRHAISGKVWLSHLSKKPLEQRYWSSLLHLGSQVTEMELSDFLWVAGSSCLLYLL